MSVTWHTLLYLSGLNKQLLLHAKKRVSKKPSIEAASKF
jgi:hypothetical protein